MYKKPKVQKGVFKLMNNANLKLLLKEYEQKRLSAFLELDRRKEDLYASSPRLQEIDNELSQFALNTAKSILSSGCDSCLQELKEKIESLKLEKQNLLQSLRIRRFFFQSKI